MFRIKCHGNKRADLYEKQKGICHLCKLPMPESDATYDHIVPISDGGKRENNLALAHSICNGIRGNNEIREPEYYIKKTARYWALKNRRLEYSKRYFKKQS